MSARAARALVVVALLLGSCGGGDAGAGTWEIAHTSTHWWMSAHAASPSEQWIVGGTADAGSILRFDGTSVTQLDHGQDVPLLNWVHGVPGGELVAVGNDGTVLRSPDGASWSRDDPVTDQDLWGVWGSAPDDLWAVGGDPAGGTATVLRDVGDGFGTVVVPELERPGVDVFFKVWGSGPDDVYVVGQNGAVLHWNGAVLEELHVGVGADLIGVWGTGPDRVVVVGGRTNGEAAVWDGESWETADLAGFPGLNGVWLDGGMAHVVGDRGATGTIVLETLEASLTLVDVPISIHAIAGTPTSLTAVGGDFTTGDQGPFLGQVLTAER